MTNAVGKDTANIPDQLVAKLQAAFAGDLVSVVLYGSAAVDDYNPHFSDYNVLCVLRDIGPEQLRLSEPIFRWWRDNGNPSPLLLTTEEVRNSTDCFPIEFHDIRSHHRILFGEDVTEGMEIGDNFYRAQVEHDLRSKLLRLRQKASGIHSDKDVLRSLLTGSVATFCVLIRHVLILSGDTPPVRKRDIVTRAQTSLGIDAQPFLTLLDLREEKVKAKSVDPDQLLGPYMKEIGKAIQIVDALENKEATR